MILSFKEDANNNLQGNLKLAGWAGSQGKPGTDGMFPMRTVEELEMTNKWGIPSRVLRNATKYDIPDPVVRHAARRDKSCVYCKLRFRIGAAETVWQVGSIWTVTPRSTQKCGTSHCVAGVAIPAENLNLAYLEKIPATEVSDGLDPVDTLTWPSGPLWKDCETFDKALDLACNQLLDKGFVHIGVNLIR